MPEENVKLESPVPGSSRRSPDSPDDKKRPLWQRVAAATFLPFSLLAGLLGRGPGPGAEPAPHSMVYAAVDLAENVAETGSAAAEAFNEPHRQKRERDVQRQLDEEAGADSVARPPVQSGQRPAIRSEDPPELIRRAYENVSRTTEDYSSKSDADTNLGAVLIAELNRTFVRDHLPAVWEVFAKVHEDFRVEVEEFIDRDEHVFASLVIRMRYRNTDHEAGRREAHVWTVRKGRVVEFRDYPTMDKALEAAGLS